MNTRSARIQSGLTIRIIAAITIFVIGIGVYVWTNDVFPATTSFIVPMGSAEIDTEPVMLANPSPGVELSIDSTQFAFENLKWNFNISSNKFKSIYNNFQPTEGYRKEWEIKKGTGPNVKYGPIEYTQSNMIHINKDGLVDSIVFNMNRPFEWKHMDFQGNYDYLNLGVVFQDVTSDKELYRKFEVSTKLINDYRRNVLKQGIDGDEGAGAVSFIHRGINVGVFYNDRPNARAVFVLTPAR